MTTWAKYGTLYDGTAALNNLQRWINRDPIAEQGGINLYAYVENDPVNATDPQGYGTITTVNQAGQVTVESTASVKPGWRPHSAIPSEAVIDESINCWPSSPLDFIPAQGLGRTLTAQAKFAGCVQECERRFKICGGDQNKYVACVNLCEVMRERYLLGARSTGRDLRPRATVLQPAEGWWSRALNLIRSIWNR